MRFYADENFPLAVVIEDGRANKAISDEKVLTRSTKLDRVLLTINRRDFLRLHNSGKEHSGMILCTFDAEFEGRAGRIHETCENSTGLSRKVIRVNRPG